MQGMRPMERHGELGLFGMVSGVEGALLQFDVAFARRDRKGGPDWAHLAFVMATLLRMPEDQAQAELIQSLLLQLVMGSSNAEESLLLMVHRPAWRAYGWEEGETW